MRIAHVADFYLPRVGGIEMHVQDLARRQAEAGHEVTVLTSSPDPDARTDASAVAIRRVTDGLRRASALHPAAPALVVRALRETRADVVHAHAGVWSPLAFAGAWAAQARGVPTVVTCHSLLSWSTPLYRGGDKVLGWSRRRVQWTAVSEVAARPLRALLPVDTEVQVLPNAVDAADWETTPVARDRREVVVVAVMRLAGRKRARPLLRMLSAVNSGLPPDLSMRAVIVGDGPQRALLERDVNQLGLQDVVQLTGSRSRAEIRALYARADVFIAPATLESFGIAALEARCAGLPVVAMRESGIRDFVRDGVEGILCVDDTDMIAALRRLTVDPELREGIACHNRAHPPTFDWPHALASTQEAYLRAAQIVHRELPAAPEAAPSVH